MTHSLVLPRLIRTGSGSLAEIGKLLACCGVSRPLIVTDPTMVSLGYVGRLTAALAEAGLPCGLFSETEPEPTETSVVAAEAILRAGLDGQAFDGLVALGGGSAIDTAKALAVLGPHGGRMRDYKVPRLVDEPGMPVIAIPTTAGTGSEATRVTVITDPENDEKMLCMGLAFMPVAAILDPDLTLSLPSRVTADTGIDALTHAIEAYVSRKASPFSDQQALAAMRLIAPNLRRAFHDGQDAAAREALLVGACFGGIAFSNASVALVHGMSRPIGAFFHVPHGLSNAMLLPAVTAWSIPAAPTRYADCARAMGLVGEGAGDELANGALLEELRGLNAELGVPTPTGFGIEPARWQQLRPLMAEQALASGSPGNNPRIPTADEIIALYDEVWG
ncbi:iron-containing alcohol dehydrogenase [Maricaulis maris]|jgi:alcohol dehydrogenase class IV|uniref:Alcohol dehydrogenase 2 n=1 Tax=Maricaulis maris (strain MCS10) TaxID=394221 RepID=Q0ALN2_MARMM|nr:iron-containing alcohol dehydrogenase [Maricaulis maris]ABI66811.1 iron-containing alcohol dehydrogenase [Maricaulis maris MCS10]